MKVKVEPIEFRGLPQLRISISTNGYEIVNIKAVLNLLKWLTRSEDLRYPPENGFRGGRMLLDAINDVYKGMDVGLICKKYKVRDAERDIIEWIVKPPEEKWEEWVKNSLLWTNLNERRNE